MWGKCSGDGALNVSRRSGKWRSIVIVQCGKYGGDGGKDLSGSFQTVRLNKY